MCDEKNIKKNEANGLAVTNVQVYPFKKDQDTSHRKGIAIITLNDQLVLRGLRIMDGENGMFIGYPNDPFYKGEDFRSLFYCCGRELREHIENVVLEKYQESIKG